MQGIDFAAFDIIHSSKEHAALWLAAITTLLALLASSNFILQTLLERDGRLDNISA